jgi:hypothetical protein
MSATADLIIRIVEDTSAAQKPLDQSASRVDKMGRSLNKLALPAAAVVAGIAAVGKAAVDSASRTQQAMGALDSVFGKNSGQVKAWAANAATAVGLSKSQYGELATVIGAQLKNMGIPFDQIAGKTNDLVNMGADLAATFGGSTADAVSALSATLRGETDPIERYGVSIKQATIDAKMAADGTDKLTGAAGKQARTMATLSLITEQTADAHGQFARESDSAAGAAQIQAAQIENLKSSLGTALLPIVARVAGALGKFAAFAEKNTTLVQILAGVILALATAVLVLVAALKVYNLVTEIMAVVSKSAWLSALGPIALVIIAVIAVVAVIVILWKKSQTFRNIVLGVWAAIKGAALAVARAVSGAWRATWAALSGAARAFAAAARAVWTAVRTAASAVASVVKTVWRAVWSVLSAYVRAYVAVFRAVFTGVSSAASTVAHAVTSAWATVWGGLERAASAAGRVLAAPFNTVRTAIESVITAVQNLISWLGRIKVPSIKIPHIPGVNLGAASAPAPAAFGAFAAPRVTGVARQARAAPGGVVININGALDPEGVARQVERILGGHDRRVGRTASG